MFIDVNRTIAGGHDMRSKAFQMNPEDLEKYDPDQKADSGLRAALQDASERQARALHRLLTGVSAAPEKTPSVKT